MMSHHEQVSTLNYSIPFFLSQNLHKVLLKHLAKKRSTLVLYQHNVSQFFQLLLHISTLEMQTDFFKVSIFKLEADMTQSQHM